MAFSAVDGDNIACFDRTAERCKFFILIINTQITRAGHTWAAHAARHNGRVRGHAAARRDNRFGRVHAVNIFRAGFNPHQNNFRARLSFRFSFIRAKYNFANRRARRGRQSCDDQITRRVYIQRRMQELIERERINPAKRFFFGNLSRFGHFHRNP